VSRDVWRPWLRVRAVAAAGWTGGNTIGRLYLVPIMHEPGSGDYPVDGLPGTDGVRTSVGFGVSGFWDQLRLDLVRGLSRGGGWQLLFSIAPDFGDMLGTARVGRATGALHRAGSSPAIADGTGCAGRRPAGPPPMCPLVIAVLRSSLDDDFLLVLRDVRHIRRGSCARTTEHDQLPDVHFCSRDRHAILLEAVVLHPALDVEPVALADVLLRDLGEPVPEGETMPLGPLLDVAVLPGHAAARREREMRDAHTAG